MPHIFNTPPRRCRVIGRTCSLLTLAVALTLAGCASVPPPDGAMNLAQSRLQAARDAEASDYAPVDLGFAQDKFQQAQAAMSTHDYAHASQLAEESRADAELARAKARLAAARAKIKSQLDANASLRRQMEQAHPDLPPADGAASLPPQSTQSPGQPGFAPVPDNPNDNDDGSMPAPSSSDLSAPMPADGSGFQTVPSDNNQEGQP